MEKNYRSKWVDAVKGLAILAVMVDHVEGRLYTNSNFAYLSYFSVCAFIIVMGITTYWSFDKKNDSLIIKVKSKCIGILEPYLSATLIYCVTIYKTFDLEVYVHHLLYFNASPPFYYVSLYIQLVLITPIVYRTISHVNQANNKKIEYIGIIVVLVIAWLTTSYTNILSIYGGGGKLFGGTYLVLLYVGMLLGKYCNNMYSYVNSRRYFCIYIVLLLVWMRLLSIDRFKIDQYLPYGSGINPPSISLCIYAILIVMVVFLLEKTCINQVNTRFLWGGVEKYLYSKFVYLGRHTLYIFLYHKWFIDYVLIKLEKCMINIWIKRFSYFILMIFESILIEKLLKKVHRYIEKVYG